MVFVSGSFSTALTLQHVFAHMDKVLFACARCRYTSKTESSINGHISLRHNTTGIGNYTDLSADHEAEIIEMIARCFDQSAAKRGDDQHK